MGAAMKCLNILCPVMSAFVVGINLAFAVSDLLLGQPAAFNLALGLVFLVLCGAQVVLSVSQQRIGEKLAVIRYIEEAQP